MVSDVLQDVRRELDELRKDVDELRREIDVLNAVAPKWVTCCEACAQVLAHLYEDSGGRDPVNVVRPCVRCGGVSTAINYRHRRLDPNKALRFVRGDGGGTW